MPRLATKTPMHERGHLAKMKSWLDEPIRYELELDETSIDVNGLCGEKLRLRFTGAIHCVLCGRQTNKSFGTGFCYPCFRDAPQASPCIIHPELCEGHLGRGRDPEWEADHHVQPHVLYLAITSGLKVGVTRETEVPTRWIDQGAAWAIRLAHTPNRYDAGRIEVFFKNHVSDRTAWQTMLKNRQPTDIDLAGEKHRLRALLPDDLGAFGTADDTITELTYPVRGYPLKVKSINLDKTPEVEGVLWGIKGQYLMLQDGRVLNVRKHSGYEVELAT